MWLLPSSVGNGLLLNPGTPAPELQPTPDMDMGAMFGFAKQARPCHRVVVTMGQGKGSQCGTLWKKSVCSKWHVFYPLLVSHGSSAPRRPPNLCVKWQASATSCEVLAQLLSSSLVTTNCFLDVPFIPPRDLSGTLSQRQNSCFPLFCCVLYQAVLWLPSCSCLSLYLSLRLQFVLCLLAIRSFEWIYLYNAP